MAEQDTTRYVYGSSRESMAALLNFYTIAPYYDYYDYYEHEHEQDSLSGQCTRSSIPSPSLPTI